MNPRPILIILLLSAIAVLPLAFGEEDSATSLSSRYTQKDPSRDGTGKVYLGREMAQVVGHGAVRWLERPEREREELPGKVIENMELKPTDVVADIGAGSGYFTFRMAPKVPEGKVLAVDIQQEMLDFIEGRKKETGHENVETILGKVDDTRLPEGQVDAVLMVDAYHEFSHPWEMMTSIVKGLKVGGRVILLEYRGEDPTVPIKPLHKMTERQAVKEMKAVGLEHVETREFLPSQHFMIFRKPAQSGQ
ncbi:MAG: class I SAM-dependent methyltransferase [Verrucomicrobiae bacterium]|nr:class I SAM-dependent methyltransferase [Verrucomicrobiae bacterium]